MDEKVNDFGSKKKEIEEFVNYLYEVTLYYY